MSDADSLNNNDNQSSLDIHEESIEFGLNSTYYEELIKLSDSFDNVFDNQINQDYTPITTVFKALSNKYPKIFPNGCKIEEKVYDGKNLFKIRTPYETNLFCKFTPNKNAVEGELFFLKELESNAQGKQSELRSGLYNLLLVDKITTEEGRVYYVAISENLREQGFITIKEFEDNLSSYNFSEEELSNILAQIVKQEGSISANLHNFNLLHGDLNPGNVMIRIGEDKKAEVLLIDLGCCARIPQEINEDNIDYINDAIKAKYLTSLKNKVKQRKSDFDIKKLKLSELDKQRNKILMKSSRNYKNLFRKLSSANGKIGTVRKNVKSK